MNIQNKKIYEALLIGLRDQIIQHHTKNMNEQRRRHDSLKKYPIDGNIHTKTTPGAELLDEKDQEQIRSIEKALHRLQSGSYATCESCHGSISEQSLGESVLPWPTRCCKCETAERVENNKNTTIPFCQAGAINLHQI